MNGSKEIETRSEMEHLQNIIFTHVSGYTFAHTDTHTHTHTTQAGFKAFGFLVLQDCASPISLTSAPCSLNLLEAQAYNLFQQKYNAQNISL